MCAQRKQAVKAPRRAAPASAPATESKLAKTPTPSSKTPAVQKNQEKAPNFFRRTADRVGSIIRDTRSEIKKITWPDRETTRKLTLLVLGVSVVLGLALGGIDYFLFRLFEAI
jgi:preprotein translocase subunit SecE